MVRMIEQQPAFTYPEEILSDEYEDEGVSRTTYIKPVDLIMYGVPKGVTNWDFNMGPSPDNDNQSFRDDEAPFGEDILPPIDRTNYWEIRDPYWVTREDECRSMDRSKPNRRKQRRHKARFC